MHLCSNNQLFLQKWDEANAAIDAQCSERLHRAQLGHCDFLLRALAARRLSQAHKTLCRRAAGNPAIHAGRSMDWCSDSQVAEKVQLCCGCVLVSF